jgi:hypothetical protein
MDVVGQVVSDWTVPQVMILVMVLPEASMASLEASVAADEEAKHPAKPRLCDQRRDIRQDSPGKTVADLILNQKIAPTTT